MGVVVPIPTLLPDTVIGEFPTVEVPVNVGTVPDVPLPVTVCPIALDPTRAHKAANLITSRDMFASPDSFVFMF